MKPTEEELEAQIKKLWTELCDMDVRYNSLLLKYHRLRKRLNFRAKRDR